MQVEKSFINRINERLSTFDQNSESHEDEFKRMIAEGVREQQVVKIDQNRVKNRKN